MSGQEFEGVEGPGNPDQTKTTRPEPASAAEPVPTPEPEPAPEPARTEAIEAGRPAPTRFFEVPVETTSLEADPVDRIDWTDPPASLDLPAPVDPADPVDPVDPADPADPNPLDLPAAPVFTAEPSFRPENESTETEPGFVGYITKKRGPETPPNPGGTQPEFTPAGPPQTGGLSRPPEGWGTMTQSVTNETEPGIRTRTVIIGLILLAVGISALLTQLGGISLNPAAVALTVMLAAGVTLMSAAIKRTKTPS